jgi:hypothetical protein
MNKKISVDAFDDIPVGLTRRGAHRSPKRTRSAFVKLAWAALATGVLVTAGVGGLVVVSDTVSLRDFSTLFAGASPTPTPTAVVTAVPTLDPALLVNVLNATDSPGVASTVVATLGAAGWQVGSGTNASEVVERTVVYYGDPSLEGAARGVLASMVDAGWQTGPGSVDLSDAFIESPAQLTVVLGADFLGPISPKETPAAT